jgi:hypothetical protein
MFVRLKRSVQTSGTYEYLQIVESVRDGASVRQRVIANLGRRDRLVADGALDALLSSLAKFSERLRVVEAVRSDGVQAHAARSWGPALVFERLWHEQGVDVLLRQLAEGRRFGFDPERVAFALALQRLSPVAGSDLQGAAWLRTVECAGLADLELWHLYRTVGWLAQVREAFERSLFLRDRDLFTQTLDLVFIDTTSTFVYRGEPTELRRRGYSRDRMPECPQVVICLAVDRHGWPIAWDLLPGNTADTVALAAMIKKLRERLRIGRITVVADRGMISRDSIALLEGHAEAPFDFILGCRMRQHKEVTEEVLSRAGRFHKVQGNLEVKQVVVGPRRYIVCSNPLEVRKDAAARAAILAKLEQALAHGPKAVVSNVGFKRFLRIDKGAVRIDKDAVERDARLDGKFVLLIFDSLFCELLRFQGVSGRSLALGTTAWRLLGDRGDQPRRAHAGGGEGGGRLAGQFGAQPVAHPVEGQFDRLDLVEVAHQVGPGDLDAALVESALQIDLQPQRKEAADDVADRGVVAMMEDGADLERALGLAKRPLDAP